MMTVAVVATSGALDGQILLRYAPGIGSAYRMHVWTEATTTVTRGADGITAVVLELEAMESLTRRVTSATNGVFHVVVTGDSTTARIRRDGGEWETVETIEPLVGGLSRVTLTVDDRIRIRSAPPDGGQLFRGLAGGIEAPLPESPVGRLETWTTELGVRLVGTAIPDEEVDVREARLSERLRVNATFALDSVLTRGGETLAFMTYQGVIMPVTRTVPSDVASSSVTIGGTSDGVLIWSTLWDAYVLGSSHTHVAMRVRVFVYGEEPTTVLALDSDVVSRFQVRP